MVHYKLIKAKPDTVCYETFSYVWKVQEHSRKYADKNAKHNEQHAPGYGNSWEFINDQEYNWRH